MRLHLVSVKHLRMTTYRIPFPEKKSPDPAVRNSSLRLQGRVFAKGIGVHAPSQLLFKIKPDYKRFVALVGIDDQILDHDSGMHVAHLPSVVFRVFIDGKLISESPVMRTGRVWRFNIPIATHNSTISLATMDAADGRFQDIASWVDAGFTLRKP